MTTPHPLEGTSYEPVVTEYSSRDAVIYALAVGGGEQLSYVLEDSPDFRMLPTFPVILAFPKILEMGIPEGSSHQDILHGEQHLELHAPIPTQGRAETLVSVASVWDKGTSAVVNLEARVTVGKKLVATTTYSQFVRGGGGWGGERGSSLRPIAVEAEPDFTGLFTTRPEQAVLYRLTGDVNPLHVYPDAARRAGLDRPILQGLCTYGIATRVASASAPHGSELRSVSARFTGVVYPGETLRVEAWMVPGKGAVGRVVVDDRDAVVIDPLVIGWGPQLPSSDDVPHPKGAS